MAFNEVLAQLRKERGLTQQQLAQRLYVTRQAVSRWENGETTPGIDMLKLLAVILEVPVGMLLEVPDGPVCQSCGMPLSDPSEVGTESDGSPSRDFCIHCYRNGKYRYDGSMDEIIEGCAPYLVRYAGMSLDEAVSFMGAMLPSLKRWRLVQENEARYGAEARARYGDEAVDAANKRVLAMSEWEWCDTERLSSEILKKLGELRVANDPDCEEAGALCAMHATWLNRYWPEGMYSAEAHLSLAEGYLQDERFIKFYDDAAGKGATEYLVAALRHWLA